MNHEPMELRESQPLEVTIEDLPTELLAAIQSIPEGKLHSVDITNNYTIWTTDALAKEIEKTGTMKGQVSIFDEPAPTLSPGADRIVRERLRQIFEEGFSREGDRHRHESMELLQAALCYAWHALGMINDQVPAAWPWDADWWKPGGPVRDLEKAGALIAAQIDRLLADGVEA